jgi:hypothetical protein
MKPYGVKVIENPDVGDIKEMGSKSSAGKIAGRSGDFRPYSNSASRAATRRHWARKARREGQKACVEE